MSSSSGPSQTSGQRLPTQLLLWQEVCCRVVYRIREGGSPLLSVFCGSIICWTCGKCYGIVKRLPGSPRHHALLWVNRTARLPTLPCLAWRLLALHNAGLATRREAAPGGPVDAEFAP